MSHSAVDDTRLTDLALAAGRGDRAALEAFVRATQRDVWRFLAHLSGARGADDLAQETYLRALRSLPRFEGRSSARTWLLSIARRVAADQVRYERARPVSPVDAAAVERPQPGGFEEVVELNVMLDGLDPERREALLLTQVLGLSYQETAEVCGCPIGTVRSRVARAREDLLGDRRRRSAEIG
ncbi:RNA polymerase sigma-70 factor, ECF subfamily [Saccharopolyspora kobensis]|uniref:RNA polymerase sigma factor n=1 Tax=Saccharopolyspora kobensis TaxID=146035 RepID=A0A1H5XY80_9PSEU|nr:sigma-70 family RNA polymerase sigma factor [Saccharopolyspora kobensis]SEG16495.1 RNA polymerase sigma-70 factor, ECF subfamily [Saccharopolyspora kobensis]SFF10363.1 RNA polymerase sigma-70 factor, ECF subfamily [Saccharopolyspora kobensis]